MSLHMQSYIHMPTPQTCRFSGRINTYISLQTADAYVSESRNGMADLNFCMFDNAWGYSSTSNDLCITFTIVPEKWILF